MKPAHVPMEIAYLHEQLQNLQSQNLQLQEGLTSANSRIAVLGKVLMDLHSAVHRPAPALRPIHNGFGFVQLPAGTTTQRTTASYGYDEPAGRSPPAEYRLSIPDPLDIDRNSVIRFAESPEHMQTATTPPLAPPTQSTLTVSKANNSWAKGCGPTPMKRLVDHGNVSNAPSGPQRRKKLSPEATEAATSVHMMATQNKRLRTTSLHCNQDSMAPTSTTPTPTKIQLTMSYIENSVTRLMKTVPSATPAKSATFRVPSAPAPRPRAASAASASRLQQADSSKY